MNPTENFKAEITESSYSYKINNGKISLELQKKDGGLISLKNGNREYLGGIEKGNFTIYYDNTSDMWSTTDDLSRLTKVTSSQADEVAFETEENSDGMDVKTEYTFGESKGGFLVSQTISLKDGEKTLSIKYSIKNQSKDKTIVAFVGAQLDDLKEDGASLFWPYNEGEILDNAVKRAKESSLSSGKQNYMYAVQNVKKISYSYPVGMSMQMMQLFDGKDSIYYYSKDSAYTYKKLNFGIFDGDNEYKQGSNAVSMSITHYPFVEPNKTVEIPQTVIGAGGANWYDGSDEYRNWVLSIGARMNDYGRKAKNLTGILAWKIRETSGKPNLCYDNQGPKTVEGHDMASALGLVENIGIDTLYAMGWHEEGFDTKFPDYEFIEDLGGEKWFKSGVDKVNANGDTLMGYLNVYLVNNDSKWYLEYGQKSATKKPDGSIYFYDWGAKAPFVAACPKSEGFKKAIWEGADRLAKNGVTGCFLDQLMEMPPTLCFDKTHGHTTPATAYSEGYPELLDGICKAFEKYTDDYVLSCEGICDAWVRWIDVAGMQWSRELGWAEKSKPEITRYTIPVKMLGLWDFGSQIDTKTEYAYSFMMGNPILYRGALNVMISKYTEIYERYGDIYGKSVYIDKKGVTFSSDKTRYGVVAGENSFVITFANTSGEDVTERVYFDLEKMGYGGKEIASVSDLFVSGTMKSFKNNSFSVTAKNGEITAYLITLK